MFFDQAFGGGQGSSPMMNMGGGGGASALTSPGLNPQMLAMLMAMQNRGGGAGGPAMPAPPGASQNAPQPGGIPGVQPPPQMPPPQMGVPGQPGQQAGQPNLMQLLSRLGLLGGGAGQPTNLMGGLSGGGNYGMPTAATPGPGTGGYI